MNCTVKDFSPQNWTPKLSSRFSLFPFSLYPLMSCLRTFFNFTWKLTLVGPNVYKYAGSWIVTPGFSVFRLSMAQKQTKSLAPKRLKFQKYISCTRRAPGRLFKPPVVVPVLIFAKTLKRPNLKHCFSFQQRYVKLTMHFYFKAVSV